jgi:uncharacterized protein (TIGR03085 family)
VASPNYARLERAELCDLLNVLGPDQPTLCTGWTTRDLAAHLVVRERRPDASAGILLKPLSGHTAKVQQALAARPFDQIVDLLRHPPVWSMSGLGPIDRLLNTQEFFVHHEDARRGQPDWQPRELPHGLSAVLWRQVRLVGSLALRRLRTTIQVVAPGYGDVQVGAASTAPVRLVGEPGELTLFITGRQPHARVELTGPQELVDKVSTAKLGV